MERQVIVIAGPTASGKTRLAIETARLIDSEIISADSRQFYKYLDIGTAKPTPDELKLVKHHFINYLEPNQDFNANLFRIQALEICETLWQNEKIPVIAGGSGLYIKALIDGFSATPDPDPQLRKELQELRTQKGNEYLYNKLKEIDPETAGIMIPQNWKRVIRALEVFYLTGKKISGIHSAVNDKKNPEAVQFGIEWDRKDLYERINSRTEDMIKRGLIDEVRFLLSKFPGTLNSLNTVGYKEVIEYLNQKISLDEAINLIKQNTRRYAKRQMTWFRRDKRIHWLSIKNEYDFVIFAGKIAESVNQKGIWY